MSAHEATTTQDCKMAGCSWNAAIDRAIVSQIERGRMVATVEEAAKLSTALGLKANQLRPVTLLATEVHAWKETDASP